MMVEAGMGDRRVSRGAESSAENAMGIWGHIRKILRYEEYITYMIIHVPWSSMAAAAAEG
jgi:hypothetical protein